MIGNKIKERREELKLTQEELAKMIGIGKTAVSNYEQNISSPKASVLILLFSALKCDANYLFGDYIIKGDFQITGFEKEHILNYRLLDYFGKKAVDDLLKTEYLRCTEIQESPKDKSSPEQPKMSLALKIARSNDDRPLEIIEVDEEKLKNAPRKKL